MVEDARWRRAASRQLSSLLSTAEDDVASLSLEGGATAEELLRARRILVLVAEAIMGEAVARRARFEFAARVLSQDVAPPELVEAQVEAPSGARDGKPLPSYLRDGMTANQVIAPAHSVGAHSVGAHSVGAHSVGAVAHPPLPVNPSPTPPATVAPPLVAPAHVAPAPLAAAPVAAVMASSSTVDLAESGIDLDEVLALPFQASTAHDADLEGYAATVAELGAQPERRAAVLQSRGFASEDAFFAAARSWQARFAADPKLREAFERAVAAKRR